MSSTLDEKNVGKGLALPGLIVGLLTGLAVYGVVEYWIDDADDKPLPFVVLFFIVTWAAAYLLLAERGKFIRAIAGALALAAFFILPDYFMASAASNEASNLTNFPPIFWFLASRSLTAYILVTLIKATIEGGAPPPYTQVFFHGLTLPIIAAGAKLFAALALVLLFVWARLLKEMDVNFFNRFFQEPWFILPFLGAIGGLSIAMIRGQQSVLGALRYILLLFCRIVTPIFAALAVTFLVALAVKGPGLIFGFEYPIMMMAGLALAGMLIFNGVYQNGEAAPPPMWLRISSIVALLGFPVYAGLAFYGNWNLVSEFGLTPKRIAAVAVIGIIASYSIVCVAGLVTELNWRPKRWMPLVAPFNTLMAALWALTLSLLATPLVNPWAMSATSQYERLASGRVAAKDFDFGYLRFQLGAYGENALTKLEALTDHPEIDAIRDGIARARNAKNQWEYDNPEFAAELPEEKTDNAGDEDGPMRLELNPPDADTGDDEPVTAPEDEAEDE